VSLRDRRAPVEGSRSWCRVSWAAHQGSTLRHPRTAAKPQGPIRADTPDMGCMSALRVVCRVGNVIPLWLTRVILSPRRITN